LTFIAVQLAPTFVERKRVSFFDTAKIAELVTEMSEMYFPVNVGTEDQSFGEISDGLFDSFRHPLKEINNGMKLRSARFAFMLTYILFL